MTMTLELPEAGIDETPRPTAGQTQESPEAADAAAMLETAEAEDEAETELGEVANETPPAAGGCDLGSVDQPADATGQPQAEPAAPPVTDAEIKHAAQFCPGSVTPAAAVVSPRDRYIRDKSAMEERLAGLTIEEMKLKEQAKLCKKEREVLAEQLANLIDDWERGDGDGHATDAAPTASVQAPANAGAAERGSSPDAEPASQPGPQGGTVEAPETPAVSKASHANHADEQDRYRRVLEAASVAELSLPPKVEEKLTEAGCSNIWALETLRGDISQGRAKWPKGIGAAKVTTIEDALLAWMSRNQQTWDTGEAERDAEVAQTSVDHAKPEQDASAAKTTERDPLDDL